MPTVGGFYWIKLPDDTWWKHIAHVEGEAPMLYISSIYSPDKSAGDSRFGGIARVEGYMYKNIVWGPKIERPD